MARAPEGDLLQHGDAGPISCTRCGSLLPTGATLDGHVPGCPVAAAERARIVMGGDAPALARQLYREAGDGPTARAVAGQLRDMASELYALLGTGAPR